MDILDQEKAELIPFHALNEFMRDDYRMTVVRTTLIGVNTLPQEYRPPIDRLTKKLVRVPGFRHAEKAPFQVRIHPTAEAFEKSPELVVAVLNAWAEIKAPLRQKIFDLLTERGWQLLPLEGDRTKMPGFFIKWPAGEDFASLNTAFKEKYPTASETDDDISLMVVWVSMRLPYLHEGEDRDQAEVEEGDKSENHEEHKGHEEVP